jgi:hypothetical protein
MNPTLTPRRMYEMTMVLSISYRVVHLRKYVHLESLRFLVETTAGFFKELAKNYPFFRQAFPILKETSAKLWSP